MNNAANKNVDYFNGAFAKHYQASRLEFEAAVSRAHELIQANVGFIYPGTKVADFGCGPGAYAKVFVDAGCHVLAIDFSAEVLRVAMENLPDSVEFRNFDMRNLSSIETCSRDIVNCTGDTVLYLDSKKEVHSFVNECKRIITASGLIHFEFRDFSVPLPMSDRVVIKRMGDTMKIISLQYEDDFVFTTNVYIGLETKTVVKEVSKKLRMSKAEFVDMLHQNEFVDVKCIEKNEKVYIIAKLELS